jgi:hypothetical protein
MGGAVENRVYHVVHEGGRLGPFDRRTIVGMKVKKALAASDVLVGADGVEITVAELVRQGQAVDGGFVMSGDASQAPAANRSPVRGIHAATLLTVESGGYRVPPFKGEVEVRVQSQALRISGRFREGLGWREDRVKFALQDIAHARLRGTVVDLWVRTQEHPALQCMSLDLQHPESAGELAESLSHAAPWPGSEPLAGRSQEAASAMHPMVWTAVVGTALVVLAVFVWVLTRRA